MNLDKLDEVFAPKDLEWKIQTCSVKDGKATALIVPYVSNRAIMNRLDQCVGKANWKNEYCSGPDGGVLCGLSIKIDGEWVTKWDGAENTNIESVKGGLSGSMKRAAVQWGIGRYLYEMDVQWANTSIARPKGKGWEYAKTKDRQSFYWEVPNGIAIQSIEPENIEPEAPHVKATPKETVVSRNNGNGNGKAKSASNDPMATWSVPVAPVAPPKPPVAPSSQNTAVLDLNEVRAKGQSYDDF